MNYHSYSSTEYLAAKVRVVNLAHAEAKRIHALLSEFFAEEVGLKILNRDGGFCLRIRNRMLALKLDGDSGVRVARSFYDTLLAWTVYTHESRPSGAAVTHQCEIPIGRIKDGILTELLPPYARKDDYTVEEVQAYLADMERADRQYRAAREACGPFLSR